MKYSLRSLMIAVSIRLVFALPFVVAAIYLLATESRWEPRVLATTEAVLFCLLATYLGWNSMHQPPAKNPPRSSRHNRFSRVSFWLFIAMSIGIWITVVWLGFHPAAMDMLRRPLFSASAPNLPTK